MTRSPLAAAAVLVAGLVLAACGSTSVQHPSASHTSSPTAKASSSPKATPTPKPTSAVAAAEAGFNAWAEAAVLLTGPQPVSSMPASERDIYQVIRKAFYFPGWQTSIGRGNVLVETPPGCMASGLHVIGAFEAPANAPVVAGAGKIALVVRGSGACHTEAGGQVFMNVAASAPATTWVLLGSTVTLPPVVGLPSLPDEVWVPTYEATCASAWVQYAGSLLVGGAVPGC